MPRHNLKNKRSERINRKNPRSPTILPHSYAATDLATSALLSVSLSTCAGATSTLCLLKISTNSGLGLPSLPVPWALNAATWSKYASNKKLESRGPPFASGWNCVLMIGRLVWIMPSLLPSFKLTKYSFQSVLETVDMSTAYP